MAAAPSPAEGDAALTPAQQALVAVWEAHMQHEFATRSADATMETMSGAPSVNHVPVLTGGVGSDQVRAFYATPFILQMAPDLEIIPVVRTVGAVRLIDEMIARFTDTVPMNWMLPGVPPTGKPVEIAVVAVVEFRDGKVAQERIYWDQWDQAAVLAQLGLLDADALPLAGAESARKVLDPSLPANALIERVHRRSQ